MKRLLIALIALAIATTSLATLSDTYSPTQYTITGTVNDFNVSWSFFATTDLVVTITDSAGTDTVLTEGSGAGKYTVSAINNDYTSGATISTGTEYGSGYQITIERSVPYGQTLDINGDSIPGEPLEQALDKLAAQIQQTENSIGRTLTIPATDAAGLTTEFPNAATRASKIASFDASGSLTVIDPVDSGTISVDDTTIEQSGTTLQVKAGGIGATQIADLGVTTAKLATNAVTTVKITDANVTLPKLANIATDSVIGRTTAATGVPEVVPIVGATGVGLLIDDDTLGDDSDLSGATQGSIKAYVDTQAPTYAMQYSGATVYTGTIANAYTDLDLSTWVGVNRAFVHISVVSTDATAENLFLRTNGDTIIPFASSGYAGWGTSGIIVGNAIGGYATICTDTNGVVEVYADGELTGGTIKLIAYQVLQ